MLSSLDPTKGYNSHTYIFNIINALAMFKHLFIFCALLTITQTTIFCQSVSPPFNVEAFFEIIEIEEIPIEEEFEEDEEDDIPDETNLLDNEVKVSLAISLEDTLNVSAFIIEFGRLEANEDELDLEEETEQILYNDTIAYDNPISLAEGLSYIRNDKVILVGIGNYTLVANSYAVVKIQDTEGNISLPTYFYNE